MKMNERDPSLRSGWQAKIGDGLLANYSCILVETLNELIAFFKSRFRPGYNVLFLKPNGIVWQIIFLIF